MQAFGEHYKEFRVDGVHGLRIVAQVSSFYEGVEGSGTEKSTANSPLSAPATRTCGSVSASRGCDGTGEHRRRRLQRCKHFLCTVANSLSVCFSSGFRVQGSVFRFLISGCKGKIHVRGRN